MKAVLRWLDPAKAPRIVMGPTFGDHPDVSDRGKG